MKTFEVIIRGPLTGASEADRHLVSVEAVRLNPVSPGQARAGLTGRICWKPIETAPKDREILLWINGAFIGRWHDCEGGQWCEKLAGLILEPVRFWAEINPPARSLLTKANDG